MDYPKDDPPKEADLPVLVGVASKMVSERLEAVPDWEIYQSVGNQLAYIRETLASGRMPSEAEKRRLTIGRYAAIEFETDDPEFADVLHKISYLFERLGRLRWLPDDDWPGGRT